MVEMLRPSKFQGQPMTNPVAALCKRENSENTWFKPCSWLTVLFVYLKAQNFSKTSCRTHKLDAILKLVGVEGHFDNLYAKSKDDWANTIVFTRV